ncbi:MAG: DUF885 domain-containing protein [Pseudomonadota bacterium]
MIRRVFLMFAIGCLGACAQLPSEQSGGADAQLVELYESAWTWINEDQGRQKLDGRWQPSDTWPDLSPEAYAARLAYYEAALARLTDIPRAALSDEATINADVFERIMRSRASNVRFKTYEAPLNSDSFFWMGLTESGVLTDEAAYRRYIERMKSLPRYLGQHMANMRAGLARGYTPPRVTLIGREASIESFLVSGTDNPFYPVFTRMPASIPAATQSELRRESLTAIDEHVVPAYQRLLEFMRDEYLPNARQTLGASELPDGAAFYQAQIREYTTLDLTPEEIHARGLSEVARIRDEMQAIIDELEFDGDFAAFFRFLRTDPQFYAKTPDELMGVSAYVDKRVAEHIHDVLGFLPRQRHTILPVPDSIAPTYTAGRGGYSRCWMNTYNLRARPLYAIPALTLHECSPGHSLQFAIAREAPGEIPEFRAYNYFSGFGEGWGLYVEWLGGELGIYRTPYEKFGQLTYEMWRACRLVIDTGVHHYGWTREQALAYLRDNAALSEHEVTTEIDRYISWPAQALSYKLGEMLIREKRAAAEQTLGTAFDQRYFHDKILSLRSVPLSVLEAELDAWINAGGPNPYEGIDF